MRVSVPAGYASSATGRSGAARANPCGTLTQALEMPADGKGGEGGGQRRAKEAARVPRRKHGSSRVALGMDSDVHKRERQRGGRPLLWVKRRRIHQGEIDGSKGTNGTKDSRGGSARGVSSRERGSRHVGIHVRPTHGGVASNIKHHGVARNRVYPQVFITISYSGAFGQSQPQVWIGRCGHRAPRVRARPYPEMM